MGKASLKQCYAQFIAGLYPQNGPDTSGDFIADGRLTPAEQLGIYRGSVQGGLSQALADIYPRVRRALGETFFEAMAKRFVQSNPSRSASLDHYGNNFPDYIAAFEPLKDYPYMADLAVLDWAWHCAFHCRDETAIALSTLEQVPVDAHESVRFTLARSLVLIPSAYPLFKLWQLNQQTDDIDEVGTIDLCEGAQTVAVWRQGLDMCVAPVDEVSLTLVEHLKKIAALGTIMQEMLSKWTQIEINRALVESFNRAWLVGLEYSELPTSE